MLRRHYSSLMQCNAKQAPIPTTPVYDPPAAQHQTKGQCVIAGLSQQIINNQTETETQTHTRQYLTSNIIRSTY